MTGRFREMPDFSRQRDENKSFLLESSESKMYMNFSHRVQNTVGYKIPRNTVVVFANGLHTSCAKRPRVPPKNCLEPII
jgi:hypothetical protein